MCACWDAKVWVVWRDGAGPRIGRGTYVLVCGGGGEGGRGQALTSSMSPPRSQCYSGLILFMIFSIYVHRKRRHLLKKKKRLFYEFCEIDVLFYSLILHQQPICISVASASLPRPSPWVSAHSRPRPVSHTRPRKAGHVGA